MRRYALVACLAACWTTQPSRPPREAAPIVLHPVGQQEVVEQRESEPLVASSGLSTLCERTSDACWDCGELDYPTETRVRSFTSHACCASGPCEQPPLSGACDLECGDRTGDGKNDRCLLPAMCPYKAQLADFFGKYQVQSPVAMYEALCGPRPTTFPDDNGDGAKVSCGPQNVTYNIHPVTVAQGASGHGPALCYGKVRVASVGGTVQRCGKFHCQTLRMCDGTERAEYCTVMAACENGKVVPTGLSW